MKTLVVDGRPEDQEFKVTLVYTESWMKMHETNESSSWQANIVIRIFTSIINSEFDKQLPLVWSPGSALLAAPDTSWAHSGLRFP